MSLLLADPIVSVEKSTDKLFVLVQPITSEVLQIVNPSASSVPNAPWTKLVFNKNASTLALHLAESIRIVSSTITARYVVALQDIPEIHSQHVILFRVSIKFEKNQSILNHDFYSVPNILEKDEPVIYTNPCIPSPCGPYSQCKDINGVPSCSCLLNYIGSPPNCRPECVINSECPSNKACIREKCLDPCPGSCGLNALCNVVNHVPICSCLPRYTGDPFSNCIPEIIERKRKKSWFFHLYFFSIS